MTGFAPPKENLFRGLLGIESRAGSGDGLPTLFGHFAVFNDWTEINSYWEGKFLERIAPGAFRKTIKERGDQVRCLFQHGYDYQVGDKPLGPFDELKEDDIGCYYEVPLLDTTYNRDLIPGLEAGLYGASFRFRVMREEVVEEPGVSDYNPGGLPERTIKEVQLMEGGPVTFGAYKSATAQLRSLTDEFVVEQLRHAPAERLRELMEFRNGITGRLDSEDVGCLAQMLTLATHYIGEQDETDDEGNVGTMKEIQTSLIALLNVEAQEEEPEEDETNSAPSENDDSERREQETPDAPAVATRKASKDYLSNGKETPTWLL